MPTKVVTAAQMRAAEAAADRLGVPASVLMDNAARAIAEFVAAYAAKRGGTALVLVGPGNNGGDGLVAARYLTYRGFAVTCYLWHRSLPDDRVREQACAANIPLFLAEDDPGFALLREEVRRATIVVDSLLGTGLSRPLAENLRALLAVVREEREHRLVLAVDVPSGLNSDSGEADEATLAADATITLGHVKAGLIVSPGARLAGKIAIAGIGLPAAAEGDGLAAVMDDGYVARLLPARPPYSHKGTFGKALVVAGSPNYVGAAVLACQAAYRSGAGLVTLAVAEGLLPIVASKLTEVTYLPLPQDQTGALGQGSLSALLAGAPDYDVLLVGPGLGRRPGTMSLVQSLVQEVAGRRERGEATPRLVLDADGLNALAASPAWSRGLGAATAITPHAGEMARLLGVSIADVERRRLDVAAQAARDWGIVVVLKGAYTVVAAPDGELAVSPVATASLATAGSGDVLAGALAGLAAQGLSAWDAARAAVYLHGRAGETVAERVGEVGSLASDLLPVLPEVFRSVRGAAI